MACNCGGGEARGLGRVTGQLAGTARWACELAAGLALDVAIDRDAELQLAVTIAIAVTASRPARFTPSLSAPAHRWQEETTAKCQHPT